jgi:peptidoglycan/xylan/chitin deacetylase (PgdA/CDA1 family)
MKFKNLFPIFDVAKDIFTNRYPSFIYGPKIKPNEIPCFCFHSVQYEYFNRVLQFLTENNYCTLSADEFYQTLTGERKISPGKDIFLTFDDGTGSIWTTVYPLLKKYDCKATVFLIPGRINYRNDYLPNLEDLWNGKTTVEEINNREEKYEPLATWEEIAEMHKSSLVDFESHTLDHSLIFIGPQIVDFINPGIMKKYHRFEFPRFRSDYTKTHDINQLGDPLYISASRMSSHPRFIDNQITRNNILAHVVQNGNTLFFSKRNWKTELFKIANNNNYPIEFETSVMRAKAIYYDLYESKKIIESHLPGKQVYHLCYPWGVGSNTSLKFSQEIGYRINYWNNVGHTRKICVGQNPFLINRIGEDFLFTLPGKGRISLGQVIKKKIIRRLKKNSPYLTH